MRIFIAISMAMLFVVSTATSETIPTANVQVAKRYSIGGTSLAALTSGRIIHHLRKMRRNRRHPSFAETGDNFALVW